MAYKLRCSMHGHSSDVRCVAAAQEFVISGSRDMTSKLWTPVEFDHGYQESQCFRGHTNFVSAVCVVAPNDVCPKGLVLTASSDKSICAFNFDSKSPLYRLTGHDNTVCALAVGKFGTIVSGSWDNTAKVWLNKKCVMTLEGHSGSVWAVGLISHSGLTITGSADKTIKMWRAGQCELTFTGHTDCVRGLAVLSEVSFLSSSNDTTIRKWLITGECEAVYEGHENFVYSIAALPFNCDFVSGGEDRSLRVWKDGKCRQVIRMPAQSVWSVAVLANGDIATGSSDGTVRIFTSDVERQASEEELKAFEEEVSNSTLAAGEIGDLKINELPGKEVLYEPGRRDGQTKLVRDGSKVGVYQWSVEDSKWTKVGDAVASAGASPSTSKVTFEGKEYDYVFDVDIEEGRPPLKLPYNVTEDPWFAAQKFLEKNDISQLYLDQVANFIMKNTKGIDIQSASTYDDPFTGQSRYKPGTASAFPVNNPGGVDPFTGGGRYVPSKAQDQAKLVSISSQYFPLKSVLTFDTSNIDAIKGKLQEFCHHQAVPTENMIEDVLHLVNSTTECTTAQLDNLEKLLHWPDNMLFPVLDVLRLAIRNDSVNQRFCGVGNGASFLKLLISHVKREENPSANCILSLKIFCNMSCREAGRELVLKYRAEIIERIMQLMPCDNKSTQIAFSTVLLNFTVLASSDNEEVGSQCISAIAYLLQADLDNEASFRLLVALGTLLQGNSDSLELARSLDLSSTISALENINNPKKLGECAREISRILK